MRVCLSLFFTLFLSLFLSFFLSHLHTYSHTLVHSFSFSLCPKLTVFSWLSTSLHGCMFLLLLCNPERQRRIILQTSHGVPLFSFFFLSLLFLFAFASLSFSFRFSSFLLSLLFLLAFASLPFCFRFSFCFFVGGGGCGFFSQLALSSFGNALTATLACVALTPLVVANCTATATRYFVKDIRQNSPSDVCRDDPPKSSTNPRTSHPKKETGAPPREKTKKNIVCLCGVWCVCVFACPPFGLSPVFCRLHVCWLLCIAIGLVSSHSTLTFTTSPNSKRARAHLHFPPPTTIPPPPPPPFFHLLEGRARTILFFSCPCCRYISFAFSFAFSLPLPTLQTSNQPLCQQIGAFILSTRIVCVAIL